MIYTVSMFEDRTTLVASAREWGELVAGYAPMAPTRWAMMVQAAIAGKAPDTTVRITFPKAEAEKALRAT